MNFPAMMGFRRKKKAPPTIAKLKRKFNLLRRPKIKPPRKIYWPANGEDPGYLRAEDLVREHAADADAFASTHDLSAAVKAVNADPSAWPWRLVAGAIVERESRFELPLGYC